MKRAGKPLSQDDKSSLSVEPAPQLYTSGAKELIKLSEKKLQSHIVEPLLQALNFSNVNDTSGPTEKGKDLIATKHTQFGTTELYAIQIKKYKATGKATSRNSLGHLLVQLRQALLEPVLDPATNVRRPPDRLIFITPYPLPHHARESFYELSRESALRPLEIVDGIKLFELLQQYLPNAVTYLSMETQYRLRILHAANQIPESTIAFQLREGLRLEDIWVDVSIGPGDRSLYVLSYTPPLKEHITIDASQRTIHTVIDSFEKWAGRPSDEKYKLKRLDDKKKPILDHTMFRIDVDELLEPPRATIRNMLSEVASFSDESLEDKKIHEIATKAIEILNGIRNVLRLNLVRSSWYTLDTRVRDINQVGHKTSIPSSILLRFPQCVYVIGGPGSGKTTLLRRLSMVQARGTDSRLPVYLPLVNFSGNTLGHLIRACASIFSKFSLYSETGKINISEFRGLLERGDLILFLDGLDETGSSMRQVLGSIDELARTYPKTQVFLSCRDTFGFPHWYRAFTVSLEPFNDAQLKKFVGRWFTSQPTQRTWLLQWLKNNSSMREVARTPLFAALLCSLVEIGEDMPATEFELYERRFDLLLGRWDRAKGITPLHKAVRDSYLFLLMALAFHLHTHERRSCSDEEVYKLATRYKVRDFHSTPEQVIEDCVQRGLLMREPGGGFSLGHLTYQEYLAGLWLAEQNPVKFVWSRMRSPWWDKALEFYAAKKKDIDSVLKEVLKYKVDNDVMERIRYLSQIAWMTSQPLVKELSSKHTGSRDTRPTFNWKRLPKPPTILSKGH